MGMQVEAGNKKGRDGSRITKENILIRVEPHSLSGSHQIREVIDLQV
jgi:hypothetical protein